MNALNELFDDEVIEQDAKGISFFNNISSLSHYVLYVS